MLSSSISYRLVSQNLDRSLETTAKKPEVARETAYYQENIGKVKTIDDFLNNSRLYTYAMKAAGLEDMTYAKAFMRKVLTEGIDDPNSFANKLTDQRYYDFAATFNFARNGEDTTSSTAVQQDVVDNYVRQTLEVDTGQQNEGARLALYFERKAPTINSAYDILADKALLQVFQTAFSIPSATSLMDIDKQADMISNKMDLADLQDPEKLQKFLTRFTSLYDVQNSSNTSVASAVTLLRGGSTSFGISGDVLSAIQSLKMGGR